MIPVNDAGTRDGHDDVIGIDVVAARTLGQDDTRTVVWRDVTITILGDVFRQMTNRHHQVRISSI